MDNEPARVNQFEDPEFAELRKTKLDHELELIKTQALIEQPADKIYSVKLSKGIFRYHRWTHDQVNRWSRFLKTHNPVKGFSKEDQLEFRAIELELLDGASIDKDHWREFLNEPDNEKEIDSLWFTVMQDSMATKQFAENLKDFFSTDYGYLYGYFWFILQAKLPDEIGAKPDSSVHAVNLWLAQWAGKVIQK